MRHLLVLSLLLSLLLPQKLLAQENLMDVWAVLDKEPCLELLHQRYDRKTALLIYHIHKHHRFQPPLSYFCEDGKPLSSADIANLLDKYSEVVASHYQKVYPGKLGITFGRFEDNLTIVQVCPQGPADKSGVRSGDTLLAINGTYPENLDQALGLLDGFPGKKLELQLERNGKRLTVHSQLQVFRCPPFHSYLIDTVRYIQIMEFKGYEANPYEALIKLLDDDLRANHLSGVVLDLRGNLGGSPTAANDLLGIFLGDKIIYLLSVPYEGKHLVPVETFPVEIDNQETREKLLTIPLVVLVNHFTFSSAEIVAGAFQFYGRGPLLGSTTGGKGSETHQFSWYDKHFLKLTVGLFYLPDGTAIEGRGITPDITLTSEVQTSTTSCWSDYQTCGYKEDPELQAALEIIDERRFVKH